MARAYDIAERMRNGNEKPIVKIDEEHSYKINTSKSAVLFIKAVSQDKKKDDFEKLDEIIKIALGKEAAEYINSQDLTIANLLLVTEVIMAAISDISLEESEALAAEEAKKAGNKSK